MSRFWWATVLALGLLCNVALPAAKTPRPPTRPAVTQTSARLSGGIRAQLNVEYARPDGKPLRLDLFLPEKSSSPLPLIVWVHGGGWLNGTKSGGPAVGLAKAGYAVASIDYRLSQQAVFPAQINDCKAAIRWLRAHAREYGIDPDRVGAWGESAGGYLVALLGTSGAVKDLEGDEGNPDESSRVQAVVDFYGPTDFSQLKAGRLGPNSPESRLLGGAIDKNPDRARRANPIAYIGPDTPPFLICHGDKDGTVSLSQSQLLYDALQGAKVPSELVVVKGAGHGFRSREIDGKVRTFFEKYLKGAVSRPTSQPN